MIFVMIYHDKYMLNTGTKRYCLCDNFHITSPVLHQTGIKRKHFRAIRGLFRHALLNSVRSVMFIDTQQQTCTSSVGATSPDVQYMNMSPIQGLGFGGNVISINITPLRGWANSSHNWQTLKQCIWSFARSFRRDSSGLPQHINLLPDYFLNLH